MAAPGHNIIQLNSFHPPLAQTYISQKLVAIGADMQGGKRALAYLYPPMLLQIKTAILHGIDTPVTKTI